MTVKACPREAEVVADVAGGRWPERSDRGLVAHVASCAVCREVAAVAALVQSDASRLGCEARIPSAAHVWWRAQVRARREAARKAERPLTLAQGFGMASIAGLAAAAVTIGLRTGLPDLSAPGDVAEWTTSMAGQVVSLASGGSSAAVLVAAIVAGLMLMPVAVYFALSEE